MRSRPLRLILSACVLLPGALSVVSAATNATYAIDATVSALEDRAARAYFADDLTTAVEAYRELAEQDPENPLYVYRVYYCVNESEPGEEAVEAAKLAARPAFEAGRALGDPIAFFYRARIFDGPDDVSLVDEAYAAEAYAAWDGAPATAWGPFRWLRAHAFAFFNDDAPRARTYLTRAFEAAGPGWIDLPFASDFFDYACAGEPDDAWIATLAKHLADARPADPDGIVPALVRAKLAFECTDESPPIPEPMLDPQSWQDWRARDLADLAEATSGGDETEVPVAALALAVERAPHRDDFWEMYGDALDAAGRVEEAIAAWKETIRQSPDDVVVRVQLARAYRDTERPEEAEAAYAAASEHDPEDQWLRRDHAIFLWEQERFDEAIALLRAESDPDTDTQYWLARYLWLKDDNGEAIEVAAKALEAGADPELLYVLGRAYRDRAGEGDFRSALEAFLAMGRLEEGTRWLHETTYTQLEMGDVDGAAGTWKLVSKAEPEEPATWRLGAAVATAQGKPREALERSRKFAERAGSVDAWLEHARIARGLEDEDESLAAIDRAQSLAPEREDLWHERAISRQRLARWADLEALLDEAEARFPEAAWVPYRRAIAVDSKGDPEGAIELLRRAIEMDPDDERFYNSLGVASYNAGRFNQAQDAWFEGWRRAPDQEYLRNGLVTVTQEKGLESSIVRRVGADADPEPLTGVSTAQRIDLLLELEAPDAAEALMTEAEPPASSEHWLSLGSRYADLERPDDAERAYLRAIGGDDESSSEAMNRWVALAVDQGRLAEVIERSRERDGRGVASSIELANLAIVLKRAGMNDEARDAAQRAVELDPAEPHAWVMLGETMAAAGDPEAERALSKAVELEPDNANYWTQLALERHRRGRLDEALEALDASLALAPVSWDRVRRAQWLEESGAKKASFKAWDAVLENERFGAEARIAAAESYERQGAGSRAEAVLSTLTIPPDQTAFQLAASDLARRLGMHDRADAFLLAAFEAAPSDVEIRARMERGAATRPELAAALARTAIEPLTFDAFDFERATADFDATHPYFQGADAVRILDHLQVDENDAGQEVRTYHAMMLVLTEAAVEGLGELRLPYEKGRARMEIHTVRVHTPTGETIDADPSQVRELSPIETEEENVYTDTVLRSISVPGLSTGSVLEWKFTTIEDDPLFENHWWMRWTLSGPLPVHRSRLAIRSPGGADYSWKVRGERTTTTEAGDDDAPVRVFEGMGYPAVETEPWVQRDIDAFAEVQVGSFEHWGEVADWYRELAHDQDRLPAELRTRAERKAGVEVPAHVEALLREVQDRVRYVGIELGVGGFQPRPAHETWETRFGDCKDQATLLAALLEASGVRAWPALLGTGSVVALEDALPLPGMFDHAILYLPDLDGGLFVDPTVPHFDFGDLPLSDRGAEALIVKPDGYEIRRVPYADSGDHLFALDTTIRVDASGTAAIERDYEVTGIIAGWTRPIYGQAGPEDLERMLQESVKADYPKAESMAQTIDVKMSSSDPVRIVETFEVPSYLTPVGGNRHLATINFFTQVEDFFGDLVERRTRPVFLPLAYESRTTVHLQLPEGWTVEHLPDEVSEETPFGTLTLAWAREGGSAIRMTGRFALRAGHYGVDEYPAFRKFLESVRTREQTSVLLTAP